MVRNKRAKFIELAEKRVNTTIKKLRLVGNLSDRNNYEYSESDIKQIKTTLEHELRLMASRFELVLEQKSPEFQLTNKKLDREGEPKNH